MKLKENQRGTSLSICLKTWTSCCKYIISKYLSNNLLNPPLTIGLSHQFTNLAAP